jgi:serine protease AprX
MKHGIFIRLVLILGAISASTISLAENTEGKENIYGILSFVHGDFDPLKNKEIFEDQHSTNETNLARVYIVQFNTQVMPEYKAALRDLGAKHFRYLPTHAGMVQLDHLQAHEVSKLPYVRWVGTLPDTFKTDVFTMFESMKAEGVEADYSVILLNKSDKSSLISKVENIGGKLVNRDEGSSLVTLKLNSVQLMHTLGMKEVMWIDQSGGVEFDMDNARIQGGAEHLASLARIPSQYTGVGIIGHVMEGINPNHQDFTANGFRLKPQAIKDGSSDSHGHQTFGIVFGDGTGRAAAKGMMPNAQGFYTNTRSISTASRYEISKTGIDDHHAMFQTASWGGSRTRSYTSKSALMDEIIFELDIPITQSQSNAGDQDSRPEAWSKNIISIGGVKHGDNADASDDRWGRSGSIGPARDGRIKPDLTAYYDAILTTSVSGGYSQFGGTSGATPIVAGHMGLSLELWTDGLFGNTLPVPDGERWENRPHFSTTKAMLINTANQYEFQGANHDLTRVHQGWGFPSLENMFNLKGKMLVVNEDHILKNLESKAYKVSVDGSEPLFKATLVFADPPGSPNSSLARVNDLNLKVTAPDGTIYWGNNGLRVGNYSVADGTADSIDTVENVILENAQIGEWTVEVIAQEVNQDGHTETAEDDVDYALVVSGIAR